MHQEVAEVTLSVRPGFLGGDHDYFTTVKVIVSKKEVSLNRTIAQRLLGAGFIFKGKRMNGREWLLFLQRHLLDVAHDMV